jgi:hypothetical protein
VYYRHEASVTEVNSTIVGTGLLVINRGGVLSFFIDYPKKLISALRSYDNREGGLPFLDYYYFFRLFSISGA